MLFGCLWLLITGSGFVRLLRDGQALAAACTLIFVASGLFMVCAPVVAYRQASAAVYAITDRRLLIVERGGRSTTSILLARIGQVKRLRKRGRVTLRIPTSTVNDGEGLAQVQYIDLHGLADGERAFELLTRHGP